MKKLIVALALILAPCAAHAASAIVYIDTGGCETGSTTRCSGTTDSASATVSGASATITCSATTYTGSTPGCSLSGSPDLSGVAVDGSQAIFLNCATNSNQKIFFITAVDNASDLVQTVGTPTGCTASSSDWGIGGRMIYASANIEAALRAGDTVLFNNTPAAKAAAFFTARTSGDATTGYITLRGKTGVRPVLATSNASGVIVGTGGSDFRLTNLEIQRGGTSGNAVTVTNGWLIDDVKITSAPTGGGGIVASAVGFRVINCEITGVGGAAIFASPSTTPITIFGNYIHGNGGNGIELTGAGTPSTILSNIIAGNGGRGILLSGAAINQQQAAVVSGNTFYNNTDSGLEVTDADTVVIMTNNVFHGTGTPFNVEWVAGAAEFVGYHANNVFYISGGSNNVTGLTINATESTGNPNFVNAAGGNFALGSGSSAAALGFPGAILGSATTGYLDAGAAQRQVTGGSSGNNLRPGLQ